MAIIKKRMPFALVLDEQQINTMEELREHPTTELLAMHRDGRLGRWLKDHGGADEAAQLVDLSLGDNKAKDLATICDVLGMGVDIDDIKAVLAEEPQKPVPVEPPNAETLPASIHAPTDDASIFLTNTAKGRLTHFFEKLKRARRQISSCADFRTTNKPFTDSCGGDVVLFRNMGTVRAKGVSGKDFDTGVVSLFQSCDEINIERLHSDFIVADGVKNFIVSELVTKYALIRADNVYIGDIYGDEYATEEKRELFVIANNIFIGAEKINIPVTFHCRDKFLFKFNFPLDDIPFEKSESEIRCHMQKLSAERQVANDEFRNSDLGQGFAVLGGILSLFSGASSQSYEETFMKNGVVTAQQYLTDPASIPMTVQPSSMALPLYSEITSMFSEWIEKEHVFDEKFWVKSR